MFEPDHPGRNRASNLGSSIQSWTNHAGFAPSGNKRGQKGDDTHWGTTRVPLAPEFLACLMTLGIKYIGGHNQLFSSAQLHVKASTVSVPGSQYRELHCSNWVFTEFANLSTMWGPPLGVQHTENLWIQHPIILLYQATQVVCQFILVPRDPLRLFLIRLFIHIEKIARTSTCNIGFLLPYCTILTTFWLSENQWTHSFLRRVWNDSNIN